MSNFTPDSISKSDNPESDNPTKRRHLAVISTFFLILVFIAIASFSWLWLLNTPPSSFPTNRHVVIEEGQSVKAIAAQLQDENIVRSKTILYFTIALFFDATKIKASTYVFDKPITTYSVAERLTQGDFDTDLIRFTVIEGQRTVHIAKAAAEQIPNFNADVFLELALPYEGRLYPETYFIPHDYSEVELLDLLLQSFDENIQQYQPDIAAHALDLDEIINLASILEREANSSSSMKMVSGILQNRLEIGMPLQTDAALEYALDAPLNELPVGALATYIDELDSPYNTYKYTGLPPTPIGNPGIDAIEAVLHPTESDYFYYITGEDGEFYYAETYNQHLINIERHLR